MTAKFLHIDTWHINLETGELVGSVSPENADANPDRIDPLGVKLLVILAENKGELVAKETLLSELWPNTVVNEEALSRCVSRLRKLLGDQPREPTIIETLPKRGYRLIATPVEWIDAISKPSVSNEHSAVKLGTNVKLSLLGVAILVLILLSIGYLFVGKPATVARSEVKEIVQQADVYYHKVTRQDNEMAVELYQRAIALSPDLATAHSGLANTLVQRAIRTSNSSNSIAWQDMTLGRALSDGRLTSQPTKKQLNKALKLAEKAIQLSPNDARTHKALGFVLSAKNEFDAAISSYEIALTLNPNAWDVLINMGDIYEISGQLANAIRSYKKAFASMNNQENKQSDHARQWRATLGSGIGDKYFQQNNLIEAEIWFRHVLSFAPFSPEATVGLANVLTLTGQTDESKRLCAKYNERIGENICE